MSLQDDPQAMVRAYGARMRRFQKTDGFVALSRRGLEHPKYRVTRSSTWEKEVDPWKEKDRLPLLEGGLMGELLYGDVPRIIDDLRLADDDPARAYLGENRSLMAIPHYDRGVGQNMVLMLRKEPHAFPPEQFADWVWMSSLFGRATQNLVLSAELKKAYEVVERELKVVADIQRSLLPKTIPAIPTLSMAAFYQTSQWAGGDYYDFFPLPDGKWGLLIADVSGHGTPGGRPDGRHPQPGPRLPRPPRPAQRPADQGQPPALDPLHRRQRGVRHRLLRDLRPGHPPPELLQRRAQPAPADAVRRGDHRVARRRPAPAARPVRRRGLRGLRPSPSTPATAWPSTPTGSPRPSPPTAGCSASTGSTRSSPAAAATPRRWSTTSSTTSGPSPPASPRPTTRPLLGVVVS